MDIFNRPELTSNLSDIFSAFLLAFVIAFLITPLIGRLAQGLDVLDLPARLRKKGDRSISSRTNLEPKLKLGGLAILISIILTFFIANSFVGNSSFRLVEEFDEKAIFLGILIIGLLGFLDDKFELSGVTQIFMQCLAAFTIVLAGITIANINFLGMEIDFNTFSETFNFVGITYNFIFPGDLITIIWIVGIINVVNWVGGVDALNVSISSIASFTLLLFVFAAKDFDLAVAILIAIHIGANLGFMPYNYHPSKIIPGSIGDYLNGYLLAIFAIISEARWTATFILFGLIIVDAAVVIVARIRRHPDIFKNPFKVLSISDKNHLHHRLMALGYSPKAILLIETAMMTVLCSLAVVYGVEQTDQGNRLIIAFMLAITLIACIFALISILKYRTERKKRFTYVDVSGQNELKREAVVKVIVEGNHKEESGDEQEDYERFIY